MISEIKGKGNHCNITPSLLVNWIINDFKNKSFTKKINELYYHFFDENQYQKALLKANYSLSDVLKELKKISQERRNALKVRAKSPKKQEKKLKLPTSVSDERKVGFE